MPKFRKIAPCPNRFRIVQGTNISNKLLATMFFVVVRMPILWTNTLIHSNAILSVCLLVVDLLELEKIIYCAIVCGFTRGRSVRVRKENKMRYRLVYSW